MTSIDPIMPGWDYDKGVLVANLPYVTISVCDKKQEYENEQIAINVEDTVLSYASIVTFETGVEHTYEFEGDNCKITINDFHSLYNNVVHAVMITLEGKNTEDRIYF